MALTLNIAIIAIAIAAIIWGAYKGFVTQIVGIIGIILGLYLASKLTPGIAGWLNEYFGGENSLDGLKIGCYIVLFIIIVILCKLIGKTLDKVFNLTILGVVNRILGSIFCLVKVGLLLCAVAALLIYASDAMSLDLGEKLKESSAFSYLLKMSETVLPHLKSMLLK